MNPVFVNRLEDDNARYFGNFLTYSYATWWNKKHTKFVCNKTKTLILWISIDTIIYSFFFCNFCYYVKLLKIKTTENSCCLVTLIPIIWMRIHICASEIVFTYWLANCLGFFFATIYILSIYTFDAFVNAKKLEYWKSFQVSLGYW
jgi:hypothetical protein